MGICVGRASLGKMISSLVLDILSLKCPLCTKVEIVGRLLRFMILVFRNEVVVDINLEVKLGNT